MIPDPYACNLDELDDGKEEGDHCGKVDKRGEAVGEGHGERWWSSVVDRNLMAFRAVVTCLSLDFMVCLLLKKSCRSWLSKSLTITHQTRGRRKTRGQVRPQLLSNTMIIVVSCFHVFGEAL